MEDLEDSQAAAEGATLSNWSYKLLKSKKKDFPSFQLYPESKGAEAWSRGVTLGSSQNIAHRLMEAPANLMTPVQVCDEAESEMTGLPVKITVRDEAWAEQMKMGCVQGQHAAR